MKEIRDSNDRRLGAIEESLPFALDSLAAVSNRQHSADVDIVQLRRETADLKQWVPRLELSEDRLQQEKRLVCLVFSGPALQSLSRHEDAAQRIRSILRQYMRHDLDLSQVRAVIPLRNGRFLIEFGSAAPGSDRDTG